MVMNIVIIEDESLLADELEERLNALLPTSTIVAKLQSIEESVDWLNNNECDLIFMDIQLSDGLSFSIFERVEVASPVIFTTAYDNYTMQAFDANGIAYILKPLEDSEIIKALNKYDALKKSYLKNINELISSFTPTESVYKEQLLLTQGPIRKIVNVETIIYFQAEDRYVFAFTSSKQRFFCNYTLRDLDNLLNPSLFFRINRAFIINKSFIKEWISFTKGKVKLILDEDIKEEIIISRSRISDFKSWIEA